jgi:hypothetical protein
VRRFLLVFLTVFVLLVLPWPGLGAAFRGLFYALVRAFLCARTEQREVTLERLPQGGHGFDDTRLVIVNPQLMSPLGAGPVRNLDFDSIRFGWHPVALFLALTLATPGSVRRRAFAIAVGLTAVYGYALLALSYSVWNESSAVSIARIPDLWTPVANELQEALVTHVSLAVPVVVWVIVMLRLPRRNGPASQQPAASPKIKSPRRNQRGIKKSSS